MFLSVCVRLTQCQIKYERLFTYTLNPIQKGPSTSYRSSLFLFFSLHFINLLSFSSFLFSLFTHSTPATNNNYNNQICLVASKNTVQQPQEPPAATTTATATTTTTMEAILIHTTMPLMTTPVLLILTAMTLPS